MGETTEGIELRFHRLVESIVDASTQDDRDEFRRQIEELRGEVAELRGLVSQPRAAVSVEQPVARPSATGKRVNLTRERARQTAALRQDMLAALRAAILASPTRCIEGTLYDLVEGDAFGRVSSAKQASSMLQHTSAEEFGDLRVSKRSGPGSVALYKFTVAASEPTDQPNLFDTVLNDLDSRRIAALVKLLRASGGEFKGEVYNIGLKLKELELWTGMELKSGHTLAMVLRQTMGRTGLPVVVSLKPATEQQRNPEWTLALRGVSK